MVVGSFVFNFLFISPSLVVTLSLLHILKNVPFH